MDSKRPRGAPRLKPAQVRILVVDDQMAMRSLVRSGLQELGFADIGEAPDGEEALRNLEARPAHLVIADYNMPKLDGLGLLRAIRSHPSLAKTPFIMFTGRADKAMVQAAVQLGVNNYLIKPFTVATLQDKIEAVLGKLQ